LKSCIEEYQIALRNKKIESKQDLLKYEIMIKAETVRSFEWLRSAPISAQYLVEAPCNLSLSLSEMNF